MDLAEAEAIKRADKNTQKSMKKDLHNTCNHDGVITHLDSYILECEVKRTLGSISSVQFSRSVVSDSATP